MNSYLSNPLEFLIHTLFGLYILAVMLRFLLQVVKADFYNPISQFLVKITNPPLRPLRRIIPGLAGIDLASIVLLIALQMIALLLVFMVRGVTPGMGSLLLLSVHELISLTLNVFLVTIFIQVILSWINPGQYNPATSLLYSLNQPLLWPAQKLIPPIGGIDLSPIVVLIGIQSARMLILPPLRSLAG